MIKNGEGERINVSVTSQGQTHHETSNESNLCMNAGVGDGEIGSARAVELAGNESRDVASVLEADDAEVGYVVAGHGGQQAWIRDAKSNARDQQVTVAVDAKTGEGRRMGGR